MGDLMLRALVVDDDIDFAMLVGNLLVNLDFIVSIIFREATAIKFLSENILSENRELDLVIAGLVTGEFVGYPVIISGRDTLRIAKKNYPGIKTVLMHLNFPEDLLLRELCPCDYFLYKGNLVDSAKPLRKILESLGLIVKRPKPL